MKGQLAQKGRNPEKMIAKLEKFSDGQLEKLAMDANLQVGGAEELDSFLHSYAAILIAVLMVPILLVILM